MMNLSLKSCTFLIVMCASVTAFPQMSFAEEPADIGEGIVSELKTMEHVSVPIKSYLSCTMDEKKQVNGDVKNDDNYLGGSVCSGDMCTLTTKAEKPHEFYTFVAKSKGKCRVLKAPADRIKKKEVYFGSVKTTADVLQARGIETKDKSLGELFPRSTKFGKIIASTQSNQNFYISIQYENRPASDVLTVGGKEIVVMY